MPQPRLDESREMDPASRRAFGKFGKYVDLNYVNVSGDTMTGTLNINVSAGSAVALNGKPGYMLTATYADTATAGAQAVTTVSTAVTGLTISATNCVVGDIFVASPSISVSRTAATVGGNYCLIGVNATNAIAIANSTSTPLWRMGTVGDIIPASYEAIWQCNVAGTVTFGVNVVAFANGDYTITRDWSGMSVVRFSPF